MDDLQTFLKAKHPPALSLYATQTALYRPLMTSEGTKPTIAARFRFRALHSNNVPPDTPSG